MTSMHLVVIQYRPSVSQALLAKWVHSLTTDTIHNLTICTMAKVASSRIGDKLELDNDDIASTLDVMSPSNLSLLDIDQSGLDSLCRTSLLTHGLSSK